VLSRYEVYKKPFGREGRMPGPFRKEDGELLIDENGQRVG
tara:strand:- start:5175 stop:5294 length:120 start_codon:yes stop_codon:yes gene_type:complete